MKKLLLAVLVFAVVVHAATHSVTLSWTDPNSSAASDTYNVFKASGACPTSGPLTGFSQVNASPVSTMNFVDTGVVAGSTYCYYVIALNGAASSVPSNTAAATIPLLFPPNLVTIIVQ